MAKNSRRAQEQQALAKQRQYEERVKQKCRELFGVCIELTPRQEALVKIPLGWGDDPVEVAEAHQARKEMLDQRDVAEGWIAKENEWEALRNPAPPEQQQAKPATGSAASQQVRRIGTEQVAKDIAADYIKGEKEAKRQPTQRGCEQAATNAGFRGGRKLLRNAYNGLMRSAGDKVERGHPKNSPK
jgi:hypothetical protein